MGGGKNMAKIKKDKAEKAQLRKNESDANARADQLATDLRICEQQRDELKYQLSNHNVLLNEKLVLQLAEKEKKIRTLNLKIGDLVAKLDRQEEIKGENRQLREVCERELGFEDIVGVSSDGRIVAVGDGRCGNRDDFQRHEYQQRKMFYGDELICSGVDICMTRFELTKELIEGCRICAAQPGIMSGLPLICGKVCYDCYESTVLPVSFLMTKYQPAFVMAKKTPAFVDEVYTKYRYDLNSEYFSEHKKNYEAWLHNIEQFKICAKSNKSQLTHALFNNAKDETPNAAWGGRSNPVKNKSHPSHEGKIYRPCQ
jgi:hypothetical protein